MLDRHEWRIIEDVASATDRLLAGEKARHQSAYADLANAADAL